MALRSTLLPLLFALAIGLCFTPRTLAAPADDQYAVAAAHYAAERWQLATDEFSAFLSEFGEDRRAPEATFYCGEALVQLGRHDAAAERFRSLSDRWPANRFARQALFRRGEACYLSGARGQAIELLEPFVEKYSEDPLNAFALPYLAEARLEANKPAEAGRLFSLALKRYPDGPLANECRLGRWKAAEEDGQVTVAERGYTELAESDLPVAAEARLRLGMLQSSGGHYETALETLAPLAAKPADKNPAAEKQTPEKQSETDALHARAALARGWALYKLKRYADAEACLAGPAKQADVRLEALYWLGVVRAADHRWSEAIEPLESVAREASDPARVTRSRAALLLALAHVDRFDDARLALSAFESGQPSTELRLATIYQLAEAVFAKQPDWSAELFESLSADGNPPEYMAKGLSGLAWCQFQSADTAGSAATFERLLDQYPDDPLAAEAALVRGQALERLEQDELALAMYERVIEKYRHSRHCAEAQWKAARLEQRLGRNAAAEGRYRALSEERPPLAQYDLLLYQWSLALSELNRSDEAHELLERLHRGWPNSAVATETNYRLAQRALAHKDYDLAASLVREIVESEGKLAEAPTATEPAETETTENAPGETEPAVSATRPAFKPPAASVRAVLPQALYLQGRIALERERWADARQPLDRLVKDFPDSSLALPARYWLAESTYRQAKFEDALAEFGQLAHEVAGRSEPWLAMVPLRQAQALAQLGRWEEALAIAQSIGQKHPQFEDTFEADYVIGRSLAGQGKFAEARDAYLRVIRSPRGGKTETAAMAQWMTGETYLHQENYDAALAAFLRVEILYAWPKWQAAALLEAGKCQELLGQWAGAGEIYARLTEKFGDSPLAAEARQRLSVCQQHRRQK